MGTDRVISTVESFVAPLLEEMELEGRAQKFHFNDPGALGDPSAEEGDEDEEDEEPLF